MDRNKIEIYTDGACSTNGTWDTAYAFVVYRNDTKIYEYGAYIGKETNNVAELAAVLQALKYVGRSSDEVIIYTDSAYIANTINQKWYKKWEVNGWITSSKTPVANQEYWKTILRLYKELPLITFKKVEAHSTNEGNNRADEIAVFCKDNQTFHSGGTQ